MKSRLSSDCAPLWLWNDDFEPGFSVLLWKWGDLDGLDERLPKCCPQHTPSRTCCERKGTLKASSGREILQTLVPLRSVTVATSSYRLWEVWKVRKFTLFKTFPYILPREFFFQSAPINILIATCWEVLNKARDPSWLWVFILHTSKGQL